MSLVVYKSSAGSGKTTTLVNEYLSLALLKPQNFNSIIALTFTIKATTEMKERVFQVLDKIINLNQYQHDPGFLSSINHIKTKTKLSTVEIQKRAQQLLKNILHNYSDFAFSTIDSFVMNVVRSFAHDLNLPLDFNVELDSESLIEQAIALLFENIGKDKELTDFLIQYILQNADKEGSIKIENELLKLGKIIFDSSYYTSIDKLGQLDLSYFSEARNKLRTDIQKFEKYIAEEATKGLALIDQNHIPHKSFSGSKIPNQLRKMINEEIDPTKKAFENPESNLFYTKGNKNKIDITAPIDAIREDLIKIIQNINQHIEKHYANYIDKKLIFEKINPLALLSEIKHTLDIYKEQNNVIHISESNKMISDIVLNEHIPFIYERVGRRYQHFLVDEFQDTSVIQWNNLIPLIDNSLASGNFNMLVGDAKQSIYRWRDGDVDQFINLPKVANADSSEILKERANTIAYNYKEETLKHNYRSELNIIEFNNAFFKFLVNNEYGKGSERIAKIYDEHEQIPGKTKDNGRVVIHNFPKDGERTYEEGLISYIEELLDQNYKLQDIAIIARTNKVLAAHSDILIQHGYKVVSNETLFIANNTQVNLITSIMNYLGNNNRKNNLLNITHILGKLHNNKRQLNKISYALNHIGKQNDIEILSQSIALFGFEISAQKIQEFQAYDMAEYIIRKLELNKTADPFVQSLLNNILENSQKNGSGLAAFLKFWEAKKDKLSIQLPENIDAIKLLTIHKSKGLEFPVVIFPANGFRNMPGNFHWVNPKKVGIDYLETAMVSHSKSLESSSFEEQYIEEQDKLNMDDINMIYVATTRPTEQLLILCADKSGSLWKKFENFNIENNKFINSDSNIKIYGNTKKRKTTNDNKEENIIATTINNAWPKDIKLKLNSHFRLSEEQNHKIERGIIIHAMLSQIKTAKDIDQTINQFLLNGLINTNNQDEYRKELIKIVNHPDIKDFFKESNIEINECAIILPNGKQLRPDKVILRENETLIIDYKVTNFVTIDKKEYSKHIKQVNNYKKMLQEMHYPKVISHLIYIDKIIYNVIAPKN